MTRNQIEAWTQKGVQSKDILKMDEPIAQRTRRTFRLQVPSLRHPSKTMQEKDILGGLQIEAEDKELLLPLIAKTKRQHAVIIEMNSVLRKGLELQISFVRVTRGNHSRNAR
jgi:hypothetical protein